jgi:hypothetical protein
MSALLSRFQSNDPKHFGLRYRQAYVIPNAKQHGSRATSLLDDHGTAFILDSAKQLSEIRPRVQRSYHNTVMHELSSLT